MAGEAQPRTVPSLIGRYVLDGLFAFPLPVTTIRDAAQRSLSSAQIAGVAIGFLVLTLLVGALPALGDLGETGGAGDDLLAQIEGFETHVGLVGVFIDALQLVILLLTLTILYFVTQMLRGAGTFRSFASAAFVLIGVWFVGHVFQSVLWLITMSGSFVALLRLVVPVVIGLILISFSVIVARFGGGLGWPLAFVSVAIVMALSVVEAYLLEDSMFGVLLDVGQTV